MKHLNVHSSFLVNNVFFPFDYEDVCDEIDLTEFWDFLSVSFKAFPRP